MPRRKGEDFTRDIGVDPKFGSAVLQKLINVVMKCGKKNCARTIVYDATDVLVKKTNGDENKAIEFFNRAYEQIAPYIEVRSRRVGGSVYQIPREVNLKRRQSLALRWLVQSAASRPDKTVGLRPGR